MNNEAGIYRIPGELNPPFFCNEDALDEPFDCPQPPPLDGSIDATSFHAKSLPGAYLIPALVSRPATSTWSAVILGRLGFLAQAAAMLALALAALRARGVSGQSVGAALVTVSLTPMVLFMSGTLAPSSAEILSTAAFVSSLSAALHLRSDRWLRVSALVAAFTAWSRDFGAPWVVVFSLAIIALEPQGARWVVSRWTPFFAALTATALVILVSARCSARRQS